MINFKGQHHCRDVILMSVRWYLAYALSYHDIEELLLERGISVDHSTVNRWVVKYLPSLEAEFTKRCKRYVGSSWRMVETYIKVKGKSLYLYRAVDKDEKTIDFYFSKYRDTKAAKAFFNKAIGYNGKPNKVTIDKSGANYDALKNINAKLPTNHQIEVRQVKYLNNIVEQDHRFIKKIIRPMKGFKSFSSANAILMGIELHHMLRKKQHISAANKTIFEQFFDLAA